MLITNGDSTVDLMRRAGMTDAILPWRDVLHEGPVPCGLSLDEMSQVRARYIATSGWGDYPGVLEGFRERDAELRGFVHHDEVVLWFEHDLYDQFQILQLLDWFHRHQDHSIPIGMICIDSFAGVPEFHGLGVLDPAQILSLDGSQAPLTADQFELGHTGWVALCEPEPLAIERLLAADTGPLPFLGAALLRHLQQFPSTVNGLARTERHLLEAVGEGIAAPWKIFDRAQEREEARFMGDSTFWQYMAGLCNSAHPLLECESDRTFRPAWEFGNSWRDIDHRAFNRQRLRLTMEGERVLLGDADWCDLEPPDRWLGGVQLAPGKPVWRWDEQRQAITRF